MLAFSHLSLGCLWYKALTFCYDLIYSGKFEVFKQFCFEH